MDKIGPSSSMLSNIQDNLVIISPLFHMDCVLSSYSLLSRISLPNLMSSMMQLWNCISNTTAQISQQFVLISLPLHIFHNLILIGFQLHI